MKKIMYIKRNIRNFLFLILAGGFLASCEKMDATYKDFLTNGQIVYNGRPDMLQVFSGNTRVKLKWYIISDPKITSAKVFWNNPGQIEGETPIPGQRPGGRDSLVIPIHRGPGTDSVEVLVDNLTEGIYTFDVYMYDNEGHASIKSEVIGDVYGATFQSNISNRPVDTAQLDTIAHKSNLYIPWFGISAQAVKIDLKYTDVSGVEKERSLKQVTGHGGVMVWQDRDTVFNFKEGTTLKYRTAYLPTESAIDTFFTDYAEVNTKYYVIPPPPSTDDNLALGKKVTFSSSSGPLTDGDRTNGSGKWQPSSGERGDLNVWFYVDLGSVKDFNTVQTYFIKDPAKITYYEVLTTEESTVKEGTTKWNRAYIKFGPPDEEDKFVSLNSDNTAFVNLKARFIKINIGLRDKDTNMNVSEIEVYKKDKL